MTTFQLFVNSITVSAALLTQQFIKTFGRDVSIIDKEAIDVILSNSENKKILIDHLNSNKNYSVEVKIEGNKLSIVTPE
jgi:hypothetical protein